MADNHAPGEGTPAEPPVAQALRDRVAASLHMGLDDATPNDYFDPDGHERWVERVQEWADWIHEQYAPHLVAAPGADTPAEPRGGCHRLSVNINAESADVLRRVKARRGHSTTEAIRWAIGLLDHFDRASGADTALAPMTREDVFPRGEPKNAPIYAGADTTAATLDARIDELTELMNAEMALNGASLALERLAERRERCISERAALASRTPQPAAPAEHIDTTPDMADREELVDVLDTHMRLDERGDAERVADALIGHPELLRRLTARTPQDAGGIDG